MNYKWGILDNNGEILIKNQFDKIKKLSDSLVEIEKKDSIGVIDTKGNIVIAPVFRRIDVSKNLILAQTFNTGNKLEISDIVKQKLTDYIVSIQKKSKVISKFYSINDRNISQVGLFGAFNNKGELKIPFEYSLLQRGVDSEIIAIKNGKFGILYEDGKILQDFKYDDITVLFDKFYLLKSNDRLGVFAKDNKKLLEVKFSKVFPISANEILYIENNVWYKVSYTNDFSNSRIQKIKLNPNFKLDYIEKQPDNVTGNDFFSLEYNNLYGIIDKKLNIIIPPVNEEKERYYNNKYFDESGKIYSSKGILLKDIDVSRNYFDDNVKFKSTIICTKDGKYGVVNIDGKIVVPFKYSYIQNIDGNKFIVKK
ncbi:WG repeat-containing protein [Chryseobacterium sp. RP-3-3]|uniref:WG repeat-containing protein n=1 Tax=Chryseobacterium antibioticum TaxID=2728847 RepID=A0A7Y0FT82_9FLAO|nr:WG repeat-containing protein [Chryseobacterium antibioticum]NML72087.1 WG repeat-containing protein [Chryseobacterium antibioticum]